MQSQTHRKVPPRPEKAAVVAPPAPASVPQEDEGGLWFPFSLADSLDKDIFSEFFYEALAPAPAGVAAAALVASGGPAQEPPAASRAGTTFQRRPTGAGRARCPRTRAT